jgi:oligopeptide transport system substrate-binding protein
MSRFHKFSAVFLALGVAAWAASAEAAQGEGPLQSADAPQELVVAYNSLNLEFDPHHSIYSAEAQIFTALYEGLFTYNPSTLDPVKSACKSYSRSQDGLTYTFYIRDEAVWSDGSPLLARDFRDAWLRALAPAEKADYASFFDVIAGAKDYRLGKNSDPASVGVTIIDDRVLQVKLASPTAYFIRLLCHHSFSPIHPSLLKEKSWTSRLPFPVNGPYVVSSYKAGELILDKNARYWDAASVSIPRIKVLLTDDDAEVSRLYNNGELEWLAGPMDIDAILDRNAIQATPMFGTQYWYFDCSSKPWNNPDLRRALALLLPWKDIRSREFYFIPAPTLVLPFSGYDKAKGIDAQDEAEAKKLLEKAGYPDGKDLPALSILLPEGGSDAERVAKLMKSAWEKLPGFTVDLVEEPAASYFTRLRSGPEKGGYSLGLTTWIGDFADPLAFLGMFTSDSNLNDPRYASSEYDGLLAAAATKEGSERLDALGEAESKLLSDAVVFPLYHNLAVNVVDSDFVTGWFSNALDIHPFKYLAFGTRKVRPNVALNFSAAKEAALGDL